MQNMSPVETKVRGILDTARREHADLISAAKAKGVPEHCFVGVGVVGYGAVGALIEEYKAVDVRKMEALRALPYPQETIAKAIKAVYAR